MQNLFYYFCMDEPIGWFPPLQSDLIEDDVTCLHLLYYTGVSLFQAFQAFRLFGAQLDHS